MLVDRVIGAFTFRRGIYAEVEKDTGFTRTAWLLVIAAAFLNQLGGLASLSAADWLTGAVVGVFSQVVGFGAAAFVINWAGLTFYNAEVTFKELVRTLGLAYVWSATAALAIVTALTPGLSFLSTPIRIAAVTLLVIAWFLAMREALDLDWRKTFITVFLGWLALIAVVAIIGMVLSLVGLTVGGLAWLVGL